MRFSCISLFQVYVDTNFIDPSVPSDVSRIIGRLATYDTNGELDGILSSFGMIQTEIRDEEGNSLDAIDVRNFSLRADNLCSYFMKNCTIQHSE